MLLLLAAFIALAAWVAATSGGKSPAAHASGPTTTAHVKQASLTDQGCDGQAITGGHFVINQIAKADQPGTIDVTLDNGINVTTVTVPQSKSEKYVAQYTVNFAPGTTIVDATAVVPQGWHGQFVLSNYLCGGTSTPTPTGSSAPPTGSTTS